MEARAVRLTSCTLNLGSLHRVDDFGYFRPEFACQTPEGEHFVARMRLHITEPLTTLVIADPRAFEDGGLAANSTGSPFFPRHSGFAAKTKPATTPLPAGTPVYSIGIDEMRRALTRGYDHARERRVQEDRGTPAIAFTCHDPNLIGGGNTILFRYINWLAEMGVKVSLYACGRLPSWTRLQARVRVFPTYETMAAAIEEGTVVIFSMWHLEPVLRAWPHGKAIYHLRQISEPYHYGTDVHSMVAPKPAIELLESLPIGVLTVSPHLEQWYRERLGRESDLIVNGIDPATFRPCPEKPARSEALRIVSVGDPSHFVKGATVLRSALMLAARKNPGRAMEWHLATGYGDSRIAEGLPANITVVPHARLSPQQMRDLYCSADIAVNPSLYEGFGLPTLEAMACGVPVVHADNRGLDSIVFDGMNCLVVPPNDPPALAAAIERLDTTPALAQQLVEGGKETAAEHTLSHQFEQFLPVMTTMLGIAPEPSTVERIRLHLQQRVEDGRSGAFTPLVSVVIPSYNQASYLREALDSLQAQTYPQWEAVVVNDGSTDDTAQVMAEYAARDPRIRPVTKSNGGITSALNAGLEHARGRFFCWLSSDDLFYSRKLEQQVRAFEGLDESFALVYGSFDILQEETHTIDVQPMQEPLTPGAEFPEALKFDFIDGCTIMIRMEAMREVGGFNPSYRHSQDMELWVRLASRGYRFHQLPEKLTIRRVHVAQSSTSNMIHCRYDAAWMMSYYLRHFHLLEMYRYFDLGTDAGRIAFVRHLVSRTFHTEANVNHPLVMERFWTWIDTGLKALPAGLQVTILKALLETWIANRAITPKTEFYIDRCARALAAPRDVIRFDPVGTVAGRDIRLDTRHDDPFGAELFEYGCALLINRNVPLFAQELFFHNTNKVVEGPFKLGHSVFRYLSQFPNMLQDVVKPFAALTSIPADADQALALFCALRFPALAALLAGGGPEEEVEQRLATMEDDLLQDLASFCDRHASETLLQYWCGLGYASRGEYSRALEHGWLLMTPDCPRATSHKLMTVAVWAEKAGDYERAFALRGRARGLTGGAGFGEAERFQTLLRRTPDPVMPEEPPVPPELVPMDLEEVRLLPSLEGTYLLSVVGRGADGSALKGQVTLPYAPQFEPLVMSDRSHGGRFVVRASSLWEFWSHGYDYNRESEVYFTRAASRRGFPGVAFTLLDSSVMSGGSAIVFRMAEWLQELGVPVTIYSNDAPPKWRALRSSFRHLPKAEERYRAIVEDVVFVHSVLELPALLEFCSTRGKRILQLSQVVEEFHYHGSAADSAMRAKAPFTILQALPVGRLSVSRHITEHFARTTGQQSYEAVNGVETALWRPGYRRPSTTVKRVMTVGNPQRAIKGGADVRQALRLLARRHPEWDLRLTIATGEEPRGYVAETRALGYQTRVLHGLAPAQMREAYLASDVYVNASWYEGFGLPTVEAWSCGVPVVQCANGGLEGVAVDGANCVMIPPGDPRAMAQAIEKILLEDTTAETLRRGGFQTAGTLRAEHQYQAFVDAAERILGVALDTEHVARRSQELAEGGDQQRLEEAQAGATPVFSFLLHAEQAGRDLTTTLDSIHRQSYVRWEAVVVADGTDDKLTEILERQAALDPRFRLVYHPVRNFGEAMNFALQAAGGEWICPLNPGVELLPEKLLLHLNAARIETGIRIFHTLTAPLYEKTGRPIPGKASRPDSPAAAVQRLTMLHHNYIETGTACIHRTVFNEVGFFPPGAQAESTWEFWLRGLQVTPTYLLANVSCGHRSNAPSRTEPRTLPAEMLEGFLRSVRMEDLFPRVKLEGDAAVDAVRAALSLVSALMTRDDRQGLPLAVARCLGTWIAGVCPAEIERPVRALVRDAITRMPELASLGAALTGGSSPGESLNSRDAETAIIVLCHNHVDVTRECVAALRVHTPGPWSLVLVDNGSTDGTAAYLADLERTVPGITVISLKENLGFPAGVNRALATVPGKHVVLLNNDVLVSAGWLERMQEVAARDPHIGIVGPMSNTVSGAQRDESAHYTNVKEADAHALEVRIRNKGKVVAFPRVAFLCTLIRSEVIAAIGGLDERFSPGNYEDDDFCLRAQAAGFTTVIAADVFVHHYGSRSFLADGAAQYEATLRRNRDIFVEKWGADPDAIWLKGARPRPRSVLYPVGKDPVALATLRGRLLLEDGDAAGVLREVQPMLENDPLPHGVEELLTLAGSACFVQGRIEEARRFFELALQRDPGSSRACLGLGVCFESAGLPEQAKTMFTWARKNDPSNPDAKAGLARVNRTLGLPPDHAVVPGADGQSFGIPELEGELKAWQGLFEAGDYDAAVRKAADLHAAVATLEPPEQRVFARAEVKCLEGSCHHRKGDLNAAKACFEEALTLVPTSSSACCGLGEVLMDAGLPEQAKSMFEWGVRNDPGSPRAAQGLAVVNGMLGLPEGHSSLDESPKDANAILERAMGFHAEGQFEAALEALADAGALIAQRPTPEERTALAAAVENFRGVNHLALDRIEEARACFEHALETDPASSRACAGLGEVFHRLGEMEASKTMFEWAVQNDAASAAAVEGLARANTALGLPPDHTTLTLQPSVAGESSSALEGE